MLSMKRWWYVKLGAIVLIIFMIILIMNPSEYFEQTQYPPVHLQFRPEQTQQQPVDRKLMPDPHNWLRLTEAQISRLSVMGRRMFMADESVPPRKDKNFTILMWNHGPELERRLLYLYGTKRGDPFRDCSVTNCRLTYDSSELPIADAVLFHLQKTRNKGTLPARHGNSYQRWIYISDENPLNTFNHRGNVMTDYNGLFNWSMTYRMEADIPVPYGRTLPLAENEVVPERIPKSKLVAIMISDCGGKNNRIKYLKELKKHIEIDIYGKCGTLKCAGHYGDDCPKLNDYMFYLAFENGDCTEYLTEKLWWNALNKDSLPVILGANIEDCNIVLPPNSFLHVRNFSSPAELAKYMLHLSETPSEYETFFKWKSQYKIVNEHGYFQAPVYHYCRVCEALNYNDPAPKVYEKLEDFWDGKKDCLPPVIK